MTNFTKKVAGLTLIEVLITILFIGISVIALIRFQNYLAYDNSLAQQRGRATILATEKMENLKDFQVLNNTSGYTSYQSIASGSSTFAGPTTTYTITWTVTSYTNPTYKNINITVSWTDRNNTSQSVQLSSNVAGIEPARSASVI